MSDFEKIKKAITKKAVGYETKEVVEEYQENDGELILIKRKVTKKDVPPDTQAAKMVLEDFILDDITTLTDEQLKIEKERLLKSLKDEKGKGN